MGIDAFFDFRGMNGLAYYFSITQPLIVFMLMPRFSNTVEKFDYLCTMIAWDDCRMNRIGCW
jgi:hypothetical protein